MHFNSLRNMFCGGMREELKCETREGLKIMSKIFIMKAKRTPVGNFQGCLKDFTAPQLGSYAIKAVVLPSIQIDEVIMGCVLSAGLGQAPARQTALGANLPFSTLCTTINKMCGSGMKAIMLAHDALLAGTANTIIAGGLESMTNAPYLLPKARQGYRLGHQKVIDHMFFDGLEDAYDKGKLMGFFAEMCAQEYHFTRDQQDKFAIASVQRAKEATSKGLFQEEMVAVENIHEDEGPHTAKIEKIPKLKPAFSENGTVTAANASSISDGAAACLLMNEETANKNQLTPLATIVGHVSFAQEPAWFTTAPVGAIKKLLKKIKWDIADVDLFEVNEAFAVVPMATMHDLKIPHEKVNVHGGACVLGHPIGASGARILVTLIHALKQRHLKRGIAALCIGGGEATAMAVEV